MSEKSKIRVLRFFVLVGVAALANVALFLIGQASGATYDMANQPQVNVGLVVGATVAPLALGLGLAWLTSKFLPKAFSVLKWGGFIVALASAPGAWVMSGDAATGIALGLMHLIAGFAWFFGLRSK
jgi:hypothetical protein